MRDPWSETDLAGTFHDFAASATPRAPLYAALAAGNAVILKPAPETFRHILGTGDGQPGLDELVLPLRGRPAISVDQMLELAGLAAAGGEIRDRKAAAGAQHPAPRALDRETGRRGRARARTRRDCGTMTDRIG